LALVWFIDKVAAQLVPYPVNSFVRYSAVFTVGYLGWFWGWIQNSSTLITNLLKNPDYGDKLLAFFVTSGLIGVLGGQWWGVFQTDTCQSCRESVADVSCVDCRTQVSRELFCRPCHDDEMRRTPSLVHQSKYVGLTGQWILQIIIWLCGFFLILFSTSSSNVSLILCAGICLRKHLGTVVWRFKLWWGSGRPGQYSTLISLEQYEVQRRTHTRNEIWKLQGYVKKNPHELLKFPNPETELKLRRFADGGPHVLVPAEDEQPVRNSCHIQ
jgi:hypothetical protein